MATELEVWQKRLETHFGQLAASRPVAELPLFALEHGLGTEDLRRIRDLLRYSLAHHPSLSPHWLVWVVYATEVGYEYDGDEYWQTFEERTPLWRERGSREQLRGWFRKFRKAYQGVQPTGPWAEWFSIIAWPITHAILPKYLQLQLARMLYAVRYDLASLHALDPSTVGRLLARTAWDASSRLEGFLEQEELAGRLVLALLASRDTDDGGPILGATLRRIAEDLGRVGRGREWLRETRGVVADRFEGVGRGLPPRAPAPTSASPPSSPGIAPATGRVSLRAQGQAHPSARELRNPTRPTADTAPRTHLSPSHTGAVFSTTYRQRRTEWHQIGLSSYRRHDAGDLFPVLGAW